MMSENLYSPYFLIENPFPIVPIPEEHPRLFGANFSTLDRVMRQLKRVARTSRPVHIVLVGPYGSGKTHFLRYLAQEVNREIEGALAAYVAHPGPDITSIYRRFISYVGYDRLRSLTKDVDEQRLKQLIVYYDFITALANLNSKKTIEAWRFLTANKLTLDERRFLRIASSIERGEDALDAFSALLKFLRTAGFRLLCIFIDEFEEINSLMVLQKRYVFSSWT